jgi:two-component system, sensor histidine kinase and response regulator
VVWFTLGLLAAGVTMVPVLAAGYGGWSAVLGLAITEITLLLGVLWLLRLTGSARTAGLALCGQLLFVLTYVGMRRGGLDAASVVAFPVIPLIAVFTAGRRVGKVVAIVACAVLVVFLLMHLGDPVVQASGSDSFVTFFTVGLTTLLTTALAGAYERTREEAERHAVGTMEELLEANRELEVARDGAQAASKAKTEFLARMSHEIRTPIHGVLGMNELLIESELSPEQREFVHAIRQSARSLSTVVDDVLDFSRIEAGKTEAKRVNFDPRRQVEAAVGTVAQAAARKGLELSVLVEPDVPRGLPGDPDRVRQVLVNLLGNAVKYTEAGEIALRCSLVRDNDHGEVVFSVKDTGVGLPPEKWESIFEPFTQVDSFITRPQPGSGLGLAISRELAMLMGGSITVDSEVGVGSTFRFALPVPRIRPAPPYRPFEGYRALCLDDSASANEVPATLLESWGVDVVQATEGKVAVRLLGLAVKEERPFDVVVLDTRMPGTDGMEVAALMAARVELRSTPAILVMGFGQSIELSHLRSLRTARLAKPIQERHLERTLRGVLDATEVTLHDLRTSVGGALKAVGARPGQGAKILVVDDNPIGRDLAARIVGRLGHEVTTAQDGKQAVDLVLANRYDLILMDCQMPRMDGYEAAGEIRHREETGRRVPIVAMTAHAMGDERERCLEAGMDDYLSKPFLPRDLAVMISRWLASTPSDS